jgi:large subunit ribosomal protein L25
MAVSITVNASRRTDFGKNASRRLRCSGGIPATVYGQGKEAASLTVDPKVIWGILHSHAGQNTIFELTVDQGDTSHALIKDFQRDPVKGNLLHVDLLRIDMSHKLTLRVPVEISGTPVGVKVGGGLLDIVLREIEIKCLPADIPEHILVDVSNVDLNQAFRVNELKLSDKIEVLSDPDSVIVTVSPIRVQEEPVEAPAAVETAEPEVIKKGKAAAEGEEEEGKE